MNILLEPEQIELLCALVEASRNISRDQRQKFLAFETVGDLRAHVSHPGFGDRHFSAYMGDIEILSRQGLLALSDLSRGFASFDVTPLGYRYYETVKQRAGEAVKNIETSLREYIASEGFRRAFPQAFEKWLQAESLLWKSDSVEQLTTIGHLCRETLQAFTTTLVDRHKPPDVEPEPNKTINRLRAVLDHQSSNLGGAEKEFLEALITYWRAVNNLVQRQEHGAQKEGEPLVWEDGRRVVFQTAVIMYELDRGL